MRFLAWREVRHSPVRFGLIAGLVALTAFLVFVLTGLTVGLGAADVSGLEKLPVDGIVYAKGASNDLSRSGLPAGDEALIAQVDGVTDVQPLGFTMADLTEGQNSVSAALLAMDPKAPFAVKGDGSPPACFPASFANGRPGSPEPERYCRDQSQDRADWRNVSG